MKNKPNKEKEAQDTYLLRQILNVQKLGNGARHAIRLALDKNDGTLSAGFLQSTGLYSESFSYVVLRQLKKNKLVETFPPNSKSGTYIIKGFSPWILKTELEKTNLRDLIN